MSQEDVHTIMCDMHVAIGSDGSASLSGYTGPAQPSPLATLQPFPVFCRPCVEHRPMSLQDAVYKMTALPAAILGFQTGGTLSQARLLTSLCSIMSPLRPMYFHRLPGRPVRH